MDCHFRDKPLVIAGGLSRFPFVLLSNNPEIRWPSASREPKLTYTFDQ